MAKYHYEYVIQYEVKGGQGHYKRYVDYESFCIGTIDIKKAVMVSSLEAAKDLLANYNKAIEDDDGDYVIEGENFKILKLKVYDIEIVEEIDVKDLNKGE